MSHFENAKKKTASKTTPASHSFIACHLQQPHQLWVGNRQGEMKSY